MKYQETYKRELQKKTTKESHKRDLQKRPTEEIYWDRGEETKKEAYVQVKKHPEHRP